MKKKIEKNYYKTIVRKFEPFTNKIDQKIISLCKEKQRTVLELKKEIEISRINIWKHLRKLEDLKYIKKNKEGRNIFVRIAPHSLFAEAEFYSLLGFHYSYTIETNKKMDDIVALIMKEKKEGKSKEELNKILQKIVFERLNKSFSVKKA